MAKRKKVKNTKKPESNVVNNTKVPSKTNLIVDFRYTDWLKCISIDGFTNMLKDQNEFAKLSFEIYTKTIPTIQKAWDSGKMGTKGYFEHTHSITDNTRGKVIEIIRKIHGDNLLDEEEVLELWQIGTHQGTRLVCLYFRSKETLFPLFVDYHHQLYKNVKHNKQDLKHYKFCPHQKFSK